jgi:DNA-binding NarL/FixJ family response regulator
MRRTMNGFADATASPNVFNGLTPREFEVLEMVSNGSTNAQVATELGVTVHAVKFHVASILRKTGSRNRTEAAVSFLNLGRSNGIGEVAG